MSSVHGRTLFVPDQYPSIQAGLNEIANDDTLLIRSGVYHEALIAPPLRFVLIGEFQPDSSESLRPLVDATHLPIHDSTHVLELPDNSIANIQNIHFKNRGRAGIDCSGSSVTLTNCVIDSIFIGFRYSLEGAGTTVILQSCEFFCNYELCVSVWDGNALRATGCTFIGLGSERDRAMVASGQAYLDSCRFSNRAPTAALSLRGGPHVVTNCTFGPLITMQSQILARVGDSSNVILNNDFVDCTFGLHVLGIVTHTPDSVEVHRNRFTRCVGLDSSNSAQGVIGMILYGDDTLRGPYLSKNVFDGCGANSAVDDIALNPFYPALFEQNHFMHDSINGLPSVYAGHPVLQPTPITLRDNIWEECGYALALGPTADAQYNYWGHSSGPFHDTENPSGVGDTITGPARFIPWLEDTLTRAHDVRSGIANEYALDVFPNPFNVSVTIEYALAKEQEVKLEIFDVLGRKAETLLDERQGIGVRSVLWKADGFASGLYFARLTSDEGATQAVKLMLLK